MRKINKESLAVESTSEKTIKFPEGYLPSNPMSELIERMIKLEDRVDIIGISFGQRISNLEHKVTELENKLTDIRWKNYETVTGY